MTYLKIKKILDKSAPHSKKSKLILSSEQMALIKKASAAALALIATAGMLGIAVVAPNLLIALKKVSDLMGRDYTMNKKKAKVARTFYYLKKRGFIKFKEEKGILKVFLTRLGKKKLEQISLSTVFIRKAIKWDTKWWQVAADIPTKSHRRGADLLRSKLKELGFCALQKSLWFYPFDPRPEIEFISKYFGIEHFVTVMEISRMDDSDEIFLKEHFKKRNIL